jgi:hypothetical protein
LFLNVGESDKTTDAVPVSSAKAEAKSADVNEPSVVALPVLIIAPVKSAFVALALST